MLSALDRKLLRDLWRLKGQVLSIALVVASGIALLVSSVSTYEALKLTSEAYYERYRFAHVFATVTRAPLQLESRIKAIDGVQSVALRITKEAVLDVPGFREPLSGRLVSIPEGRQPGLNQLVLKRGRLVRPGRTDEVLVNESFAKAHGLVPGDVIEAIINENKRELRIVGTAMSPEFIYVLSPFGLIPDKKRYGILWMGREALEAAYDYDGAFNDLALTVLRGTDTRLVVQALDELLGTYGSVGAIDRRDHLSAWFVENELEQNKSSAVILPTIFLLVAAFLTNTVLTRLITTERSEIGLMKAFGYRNREIAWHYMKFVLGITVIGILVGWLMGAGLGRFSTGSYTQTLNFPLLIYRPGPTAFLIGAAVSIAVAVVAAARAVRTAASLAPVEAMGPPAPPTFRRDRQGLGHRFAEALDQPTRIIVRQIARWPRRAAVTVVGFAGAVAMMVLSLQFTDAVDDIARTHFGQLQREDLALGFAETQPSTVLHEIARLPGVQAVEPTRVVPADLRFGHRRHRGAVQGLVGDAQLTRIYDVARGPLPVPRDGIVLAAKLAEKLGVGLGDAVEVRVLEGRRPRLQVPVAAIYDSYIGMFAYMRLDALNRALGDRPVTEYVNALIDEQYEAELLAELKRLPAVSTVALKAVSLTNFYDTIGKTLMIFVGFFSIFSFALGFGVTYNAQRIALSERGRELATLRVLGFSRGEAFYILLGESLLLACLALPIGCLLGYLLTMAFVNSSGFQTELIRLPLAIRPATYGTAVVVLLIAAGASGFAMRRWINRLDLIAVLKTRE